MRSLIRPGLHADGGNLFLVVDKARTGSTGDNEPKPGKRWVFVFRWSGKRKEMGLGGLNAVGLAAAREAAAECRGMLAKGFNPLEVRRGEKRKTSAGRLFGEVAKDLHATRRSGFRNRKSEMQWLTTLERYCAPIWTKPVDQIGTDDVMAILQPIWTLKTTAPVQLAASP